MIIRTRFHVDVDSTKYLIICAHSDLTLTNVTPPENMKMAKAFSTSFKLEYLF